VFLDQADRLLPIIASAMTFTSPAFPITIECPREPACDRRQAKLELDPPDLLPFVQRFGSVKHLSYLRVKSSAANGF